MGIIKHESSVDTQAPPLPEGWFRVGFSKDLPVGKVVPIRYFGRDLVMFRTASGVAQVLDAYCAHLGAHLGVGGKVVDETIRCPFHGWQYGTDGICKAISYSNHIPKAALVSSWPTAERSGLILVWHSLEGNAPTWQPPSLEGYGTSAWTDYQYNQRYVVRTSVQEIVENIPDSAHSQFVHANDEGTAQPDLSLTFDKHVMFAKLKLNLAAYKTRTDFTIEFHGLGLALNDSTGFGNKRFWTSYTPIDAQTAEVFFTMMVPNISADDPNDQRSRRSCELTLREFEKDIPIWENKIYRANPLICPGDGPIAPYRAWAKQFYPRA